MNNKWLFSVHLLLQNQDYERMLEDKYTENMKVQSVLLETYLDILTYAEDMTEEKLNIIHHNFSSRLQTLNEEEQEYVLNDLQDILSQKKIKINKER